MAFSHQCLLPYEKTAAGIQNNGLVGKCWLYPQFSHTKRKFLPSVTVFEDQWMRQGGVATECTLANRMICTSRFLTDEFRHYKCIVNIYEYDSCESNKHFFTIFWLM